MEAATAEYQAMVEKVTVQQGASKPPRFAAEGQRPFAGSSAATPSGTVTDPQGNTWIIERIDPNNAAQWFPSPPDSTRVKSIEIIFDEGTDQGQGYTFLDNIEINGVIIGQPWCIP